MEQRMSQFKRLVVAVLEMTSEGMTESEIARELHCGRSVVEYILAIYGTTAECTAVWG
jgi:orotate phosphoribosyltransferase-like protein